MQINGLFRIPLFDEFSTHCRFIYKLAVLYGDVLTVISPLLLKA